jgi:hypothetical protein
MASNSPLVPSPDAPVPRPGPAKPASFIDAVSNAVTQSVFTRFCANIFVLCVLLGALGLAIYQEIVLGHIDSVVWTILTGGFMSSISILGINQGVMLQPLNKAATTGAATADTSVEVVNPAAQSNPQSLPIVNVSSNQATKPISLISKKIGG